MSKSSLEVPGVRVQCHGQCHCSFILINCISLGSGVLVLVGQ